MHVLVQRLQQRPPLRHQPRRLREVVGRPRFATTVKFRDGDKVTGIVHGGTKKQALEAAVKHAEASKGQRHDGASAKDDGQDED